MRKITSYLVLMLLALTSLPTFAQEGVTIEYEAYPGWYRNDGASILWCGFTTPGTEDKSYMMSAFQFAQSQGYGAADRYTAIATAAPTGSGATLSEADVLAVSTNSVLATNANGTAEFYNYDLSEEIELMGGTTYYMVFITSNEPNEDGMYTVASQRICLLYNVAQYPPTVMNANGVICYNWIPGFKATLTVSEEEAAEIKLQQLVNEIAFDINNYAVGVPGGYPQETLDNMQEAYDEASDIVGAGASLEELLEATEKLENAWRDFLASLIPVEITPGYYYVVSALPTVSGDAVADIEDLNMESALAMRINDDGDLLTFGDGLNTTLEGEDAEPAYIWKVESDGDLFIFNNVLYGTYINNNGGRNATYGFTENASEAGRFAIETSTHVVGTVYIRQNSVDALDGYNSLTPVSSAIYDRMQLGASSWLFVPVSEETVASLDDKIKDIQEAAVQAARNDTLAYWATLAVDAREGARAFVFDGTNDGAYSAEEDLGLVTSVSQMWSNCKDPSEGSYEALLDADYTSFFHSSWHASTQADEPHYLQLDLGEAVQTLVLKYAMRQNAGNRDVPYIVRLYGTNDASLLSKTTVVETGDVDEETGDPITEEVSDTIPSSEWTDLGLYTLPYAYQLKDAEGNLLSISASTTNPTTLGAGVTAFELDAPYRYVRLSVIETVLSYVNGTARTNGDGYSYWCLSELRAYNGAYDPDCIYANMDAAVTAELEAAISAAAAELNEEAATQETIDRLKAAYAAFLAVYPDLAGLEAAIAEVESWATETVEGTEIGNYNAGAQSGLQAAVSDARAVAENKPFTYAAYTNALESLASALVTFQTQLVAPESGYYNIQSLTTGAANGSYLVARSTSTTDYRTNNGVAWAYAEKSPADYVNTVWYVEKLANGKYTFKNAASGYYLQNTQATLSGAIAQGTEPCEFGLRGARDSMGIGLNFIVNEEGTLFGNADPSAGFVVWSSGQGNDNSAWYFQPADYGQLMTIDLTKPVSIHTLPFDVMPYGDCYAVAGVTEDGASLALNAITGTISAGTPFVIVADTSVTSSVQLYLTAASLDDITYTREALTVDGLVGTFEPDTVGETALVMNAKSTELVYCNTAALQAIAANSGYFVWSALQALPKVSGGDQLLPLMEDLQTGIESLTVEPVAPARQGVYTLQGQKIANTRNLPAGIYIINGRKVLVK